MSSAVSAPVCAALALSVWASLAPLAQAQVFGQRREAAFGPVAETEERPEIRAAKLAMSEDAVRRLRVARSSGSDVFVWGYDQFASACERYERRGRPEPLPHATWGEAKQAAVELGYDYLILLEISAGQRTEAGIPLGFAYQIFETNQGTTLENGRFQGIATDLAGAVETFARRIGLAIGFVSGSAFDSAIRNMPTSSREAFSAYWLGRGYLDLGDFGNAQTHFERALAADSAYRMASVGLGDVQLGRARAARASGQWDAGLEAVAAATSIYANLNAQGRLADALLVKGELLAGAGRVEESWNARKSAALALMNWGRTQDGYLIALSLLQDMVRAGAESNDPDVYWLLGRANVALEGVTVEGQTEVCSLQKAEQYLNKALEINDDHVLSLLERGRMYRMYGERYNASDEQQRMWRQDWFNWALADLNRVTVLDPKNWQGPYELARVYEGMSDYGDKPPPSAQPQWGQAIRNYVLALNLLRDAGAEKSVETGLIFKSLARCHRMINKLEEAYDALWRAMDSLGSDDPDLWRELILIYVAGHDYKGAREAYEKAIAAVAFPPSRLTSMPAKIDAAESDWEASGAGSTWKPIRWPKDKPWPPK